jgi:hypothetical protein
MIDMDYQQINAYHTVFSRQHSGYITILTIYVDDIIIIGDDKRDCTVEGRIGEII